MTSYLLSKVICIPFFKRPFQCLDSPELYGFENSVNFRIPICNEEGEEKSMGAWFLRPVDSQVTARERVEEGTNCYLTEESETAILYLHGNADTRSQPHRVGLYTFLLEMNLPVLTFDYRGYADSTLIRIITDNTLMADAETAFNWFRSRVHPSTKIVVWGHSLGSGVTCKLGRHLSDKTFKPDGYVLEAPFLSMTDEVQTYKLANFFEYAGLDINKLLSDSELSFDSGNNIKEIKEPVLILHAKDDFIVPYETGLKLFKVAIESDVNVKMISYEKELKLGHSYIHTAPALSGHIVKLLEEVNNDADSTRSSERCGAASGRLSISVSSACSIEMSGFHSTRSSEQCDAPSEP